MNECLSEIYDLIVIESGDLDLSHRIVIRMREQFAKGSIYVSFDYQRRNEEIKRRFNGNNARLLAREYNLSTRQISAIVKDKYRAMQSELF